MTILVRRSNLLVSLDDNEAVNDAWRLDADAVTLDLNAVPAASKAAARAEVRHTITTAARGGAEIFVRIDKAYLHADLDASIWPGLDGVVLSDVESAHEV